MSCYKTKHIFFVVRYTKNLALACKAIKSIEQMKRLDLKLLVNFCNSLESEDVVMKRQ